MKKNLIILSLLCLAALVLRLIFINKPEGLWNDEYVCWQIASHPTLKVFWHAIKSQCHMPLYYIYLRFLMSIFGDSDIILRLTSVLPGVAAIPVMYLIGKEKDEISGYMCAGFSTISSFLIYYSQEVRFYSLLFLISALCLLYTIRIVKNPSKKNVVFAIIYNFLIVATHTIGFVFVFFNLIFISVFLFKQYKKFIAVIWSVIVIFGLSMSGLILKILTTQTFSQWWDQFSISKIGFLFTDYFSPVLTNLIGAPTNFLYSPETAPFMIIPTLIAVVFIANAVYKNKFNIGLLAVFLGTIAVITIASVLGKLVFITKYSIEVYPILIYLACISEFKNKTFKNTLIILYCVISLSYIIFYPNSAPKMRRAEGHKIAADLIKNANIKDGDWLLFEYYNDDRFWKYLDVSKYNVVSINKGNFVNYMSPGAEYSDIYKNGKTIYKNLFLSDNNSYLGNKLQHEVLDNVKSGQSVVMIVLNSVSFYTPDEIKQIAQNDGLYRRIPLMSLLFSYIKKETFYDIEKVLVPQSVERKGNWMVVKFTKVNN